MDNFNVAVLGAGTMGSGIAQVCAMSGYSVVLYDTSEAALAGAESTITASISKLEASGKIVSKQAAFARTAITFSTDKKDLMADIVIEAIIERAEIKQAVLTEIQLANGPETIVASNTSSLSITQIASALPYPDRFAGLHFFNPAVLMQLVEISSGAATSSETINKLHAFTESLNKKPVHCKESPGFIVNRVARPFYTESLKLLEEQVADIETLDKLAEGIGFKMGPFRLMDLIGSDINFAVTSSLYSAFFQEPRFRPSRIQQQKVMAGHLGRKAGKGFYDYSTGKP
ncbi:MAG: 3-hydroxyacyl-CoA dehydrogenase NAD-binding domain-containing protein [Bacteroidota bacterium]